MTVKNDKMDLSKCRLIKAARNKLGLSQLQLANNIGVGVRYIQKVENGEAALGSMSAKLFISLSDCLKIDPHELL